MKKRRKTLLSSGANPALIRRRHNAKEIAERIRQLARQGLNEDQIASRTHGGSKSTLRRKHADDLKLGRAAKLQAQANADGEKLSPYEETMRKVFYAGTDPGSKWFGLIHPNRTADQAQTLFSEWLARYRAGTNTLPILLAQEMQIP